MENNNRVALIIGAGDSTGAAIARRFAREGYVACVTRRSADKLQPLVDSIIAEGGRGHGFASDARKEDQVAELIETIERDIGPIEVMVFNIGANVPCSILEETARKYFKIWEMACFAGFLTSQAVAKRMVARGRGTILFTEVVRRELSQSPILARDGVADRTRLERCLDAYLSMAHLHNPEAGCAIPALGAEIARAETPVREEAEHWLRALQQAWAQTLGDGELAWALIAQCVGALLVARMLASEETQREVLDASRSMLHSALSQ